MIEIEATVENVNGVPLLRKRWMFFGIQMWETVQICHGYNALSSV